jgi:hypothetical protein
MMLSGCVVKTVYMEAEPTEVQPPDVSGVITLMGHLGFGHACPCEDGKVYTAGHIVAKLVKEETSLAPMYMHYAWTAGDQHGRATGAYFDMHMDIGTVKLLTGVPDVLFPIAEGSVLPEQRVYWSEFADHGQELTSERKEAVVKYVVGPYAVLSKEPTPGASGSCVLNSEGEVVGIVVWGGIQGKGAIFLLDALRSNDD